MKKLLYILLILGTTVQAQLIGVVASSGGTSEVDVFTQDNAAAISDNNSVGSFLAYNGSTVSVETTGVYDGSYAIKIVASSSSSSLAYISPTGTESGKTYEIKFWAKVDVNDDQKMALFTNEGWETASDTRVFNTYWTEYSVTVERSATGSGDINFYAADASGNTGNTLWIDKVQIIEQ